MKLKRFDTTFSQSKFRRGRYACPLCGDKNRMQCGMTEDGGLIYCSQTYSDTRDASGRYLHRTSSDGLKQPHPAATSTEAPPRADADQLHRAYSRLLELAQLDSSHSDSLLNARMLSDELIARNRYASVPTDFQHRMGLVAQLVAEQDLTGVPGFYREGEKWKLNMSSYSGFYVPYHDSESRISGLQIRLDLPLDGQKYLWLSSNGKEGGVSSGSPLHFVNVDIARDTGTLYLTEGALKADIIGSRLHVGVLASAGVTAVRPDVLAANITDNFPDLKRLVVAYDADWQTKGQVKDALTRVLDALKATPSLEVNVAIWNPSRGKGLDDIIILEDFSSEEISCLPAEEYAERFLSDATEDDTSDKSEGEGERESESVLREGVAEVGSLWRYFKDTVTDAPEKKAIYGLGRGNLGLLVASTNLGKSTLMLNLALSMTSAKDFNPLFKSTGEPTRVMYIDGEASRDELKADIDTMLRDFSDEEKALVGDNLLVLCDEGLNGEPLDLSNETHMKTVSERAKAFMPSLIIVDTLAALMTVSDENDNAAIKREVVQPLKTLAKRTDSAVLLLHHQGKFREGSSPVGAYKGRGASQFGALARLVLTLSPVKNEAVVKLECAKVKGRPFECKMLKLDPDTRWFDSSETRTQTTDEQIDYKEVVAFVVGFGKPIRRAAVLRHFNGKENLSRGSVDRHLGAAIEKGDLQKSGYGSYCAPLNPNEELPLQE